MGTLLQQNLKRTMTLWTALRATKELYLVQFFCNNGVLVVEHEDIESTEAVSIGDTVQVLYNKKLCNSEWAYQRCRPCYKCDVSLWFYL